MQGRFEWPWYVSERDHYRGGTEIVDYFTFAGKAAALFGKASEMMGEYPIGQVAIPSYYGAAFYCETDIYHDPGDAGLGKKWADAYVALLDRGAHVNRPRGEVAKEVYRRMGPENIRLVRNLKKVMDPKGLLNPGQLIEGV